MMYDKPQIQDEPPVPDWTEVAKAIVSHIMEEQAAQAWEERLTEATKNIIEALKNVFQDEINRARIGMATSHFKTAADKMAEYKNDPDPDPSIRKQRLFAVEDEADFARHELDQMGLNALHTWLLNCELLMAVKQEWLVVHGTQGAQNQINNFYDEMVQYHSKMEGVLKSDLKYCPHDCGEGCRTYLYCGDDPLHFPNEYEDKIVGYVLTTYSTLRQLSSIVHR